MFIQNGDVAATYRHWFAFLLIALGALVIVAGWTRDTATVAIMAATCGTSLFAPILATTWGLSLIVTVTCTSLAWRAWAGAFAASVCFANGLIGPIFWGNLATLFTIPLWAICGTVVLIVASSGKKGPAWKR